MAGFSEAAYSIYYYLTEYQLYEEDEDLAWAFTYVIKISGITEDFDCSGGLFAPSKP